MTDVELINACCQNDRNAQRVLYDRYKRAMYSLAYRMTGDFDEANDVLQDAFLSVFKNIQQFEGKSTIGAWIKTIVVRNAYRKVQKPKMFELVEEVPDNSSVSFEHNIDGQALENAILSLSEGFRTVFNLVEVEGYTHKEVAEMLGISEGTSKSQLFHAKKRLRELLAKLI